MPRAKMDYDQYLRTEKFPFIWCPGCGHGTVFKAILRAIDRVGWKNDEICMVSGIGCSSRAPGYADFNTLHTTHGRALAFATGVKMAKPDLHLIVVTGDGDATAIGGNHFIHAARRNLDITVILFNNWIYGMTGGQASPTTPAGMKGSTAPYGATEPNFDIAALAGGAGATFVARETTAKPAALDKLVEKGLRKKGFSLIEAMSPCPTTYGRRNRQGNTLDMFADLKNRSISLARYEKLAPEERGDLIPTGIFVDIEKPEFTHTYQEMVKRVRG